MLFNRQTRLTELLTTLENCLQLAAFEAEEPPDLVATGLQAMGDLVKEFPIAGDILMATIDEPPENVLKILGRFEKSIAEYAKFPSVLEYVSKLQASLKEARV